MSARLTLVSQSATAATASAAFPDDEPLDARGAGWAAAAHGSVARVHRTVVSPARACAQTAAALGFDDATTEPQLADWDLGDWRGRSLDELAAADPDAVARWLGDPAAAPHGGEPLAGLLARVARWLDTVPADGHTVAVTHSGVVRAVVLTVLAAPPQAFWRVDIAPLTATVLRGTPGRWTLRSTGTRLVGTPGRPTGDRAAH